MAQREGSSHPPSPSQSENECNEEQEQIRIARALQKYRLREKLSMPNLHNASVPFQIKYSARPSSPQRPTAPTSKILPLFSRKTTRPPPPSPVNNALLPPEIQTAAAPRAYPRFPPPNYTPFEQQCRTFAPPVTMRSSVPVFSAPPPRAMPVCIRQAVPPSAAAPPLKKAEETAATSDADEAAAARCLEKLEI